ERADELAAETIDADGFVADLTDAEQARSMVTRAIARFGRVDVLVNNAGMVQTGIETEGGAFVDLDPAAFERELALNLMTAFHATRAVLPGMIERGYGRVVMVSSVTGSVVMNP